MKHKNLWMGILAITLVFAMTAVGCEKDPADDNGGGNDGAFTSIEAMATWLSVQPDNTTATAYTVKLNVSDLSGIGDVLRGNDTKYVNLDLSGSTITRIGDYTFPRCTSLTNITIGNSVTTIGKESIRDCTNLTSVALGNSVTSIGERAFVESGLTSVTIPASVTSINQQPKQYARRCSLPAFCKKKESRYSRSVWI